MDDTAQDIIYIIGTVFVPTGKLMPYYTISSTNFDRLLQLGKSAQFALSTALHQVNGTSEVKIDRSNMDPAQKQKLKRGLLQLVEQGVITQVLGTRGAYRINDSIIEYSHAHTTTGSQNASNNSYRRSTTPAKQRNSKEPYGNKELKQVNVEPLLDSLRRKQKVDKSREEMEQRSAAAKEGMWTAIRNNRLNKPPKIYPTYEKLPGSDTSLYLAACDDFIEEITNETFFYDVDNEITNDNKLMTRFRQSIKSYDKRLQDKKLWNILIELDTIKALAKHGKHCLDLASKNKNCTCHDNCHKKFKALFLNNIQLTKVDDASYKENSDLFDFFHNWVTNKYPELTI